MSLYAKELTKSLILTDTLQRDDQLIPPRRYTAEGIKAYCEQHAKRTNPGLQSSEAQILESPSKSSISNDPFVVTVGAGEKKLTYTISPDGEPHSIVEITQGEDRSLSTDEWHEWYLASDS